MLETCTFSYVLFSSDNNVRIDLRIQPTIKDDRKLEKYELTKLFVDMQTEFFSFFPYNRLQPITAHIAQLALTTQVLPQRAACALHLVYAISCGAKFLLNSEEYIDSLSTIFVQSECDVS